MPRFMKSLNNISRCQSLYRAEKLQAEDICACHHAFILMIARSPGCSQEELAREICLNKSTVARTLTQLEANGYIIRTPNPEDKRQLSVYPTEKMLAVLPQVREIARQWNEWVAQGISEEELAVFYSVLQRMEDSAKRLIREK